MGAEAGVPGGSGPRGCPAGCHHGGRRFPGDAHGLTLEGTQSSVAVAEADWVETSHLPGTHHPLAALRLLTAVL